MNAILDEHDLRGAVERMAAGAAPAPMPGSAILAAGARRRTRRRAGAAAAVALTAALAVPVAWSALSGGGSSAGPASAPTTTNAFTDQLARTLEQVLPGAKVTASMFTDTNPAARHQREDEFPLRISYHGRVSDAFLTLAIARVPDYKAAELCHDDLPWQTKRTDCLAKDLADGGILHAQLVTGPTVWTARKSTLGVGNTRLTLVEGEVYHGGTSASLRVRGGAHGNDSGLTPATISAALEDPRFTAFLGDFTAHPERDPYGPLAKISQSVVATGKAGTHAWTLSFGVISVDLPGDAESHVNDNCDHWEYAVDGTPAADMPEEYCQIDGSTVHNPPPTDPARPRPANLLHAASPHKQGGEVVGSVLSSAVPSGTATVEASFDDQPTKLTAKVFTIHGDIPYFALVKPASVRADWKNATVRCLDATGKEIGKLYFASTTG